MQPYADPSSAGSVRQIEVRTHLPGPLSHVDRSVATPPAVRGKSQTIVLQVHQQAIDPGHPQFHLAGVRVLHHIVQGFLDDEEQVAPLL